MNAQILPVSIIETQVSALARKLGIDASAPTKLAAVLRNTAFKGNATDEQFVSLMIVAQQYGLNPWTKEIYAFPDKNNGIVPVVGVDGWNRIINSHPQFDGLDFEQDDDSCTCIIYRKDRAHPIRVTEYLSECRRDTIPWKSHPKRMLRHKALIQCARVALSFAGIYEQDEAERISETDVPLIQQSSNVSDLMPKAKAEPKPAEVIDDAEFVDTDDADTEHMPVIDLSPEALKVLEKKARLVGKSMDDVIAQFAPIHAGNITGVLQALK